MLQADLLFAGAGNLSKGAEAMREDISASQRHERTTNLAGDIALEMMSALQFELVAEAKAAAASRLLIEQLQIGRVSLLLDLHASKASNRIPFSIDTNRSAYRIVGALCLLVCFEKYAISAIPNY